MRTCRWCAVDRRVVVALTIACLAAAAAPSSQEAWRGTRARAVLPACDPDDGGLDLPEGFCAFVVADGLGAARHVAVNRNGDLYVTLRVIRDGSPPGGIVALRDTDGDGRADVEARFGSSVGTGVEIWRQWLYVSSKTSVLRYLLRLYPSFPKGVST